MKTSPRVGDPTRPTHIVADPDDRTSLCGIRDPYPRVAQEYAPAHQYRHARCLDCYTTAGLGHMVQREGQLDLFDGAS